MPTPEHMRDAVLTYFASFANADVETIVGLFADNAVVEDPIGHARMEGIAAIRGFFAGWLRDYVGGGYSFVPEGNVRIAANHAACAAIATCDQGRCALPAGDDGRDDLRRGRQDRGDEGLLGARQHAIPGRGRDRRRGGGKGESVPEIAWIKII